MTEQSIPHEDPTTGLTLLGQTQNFPSKQLETFPKSASGATLYGDAGVCRNLPAYVP